MTTGTQTHSTSEALVGRIFERVLCAVDLSPASIECVRQAALLRDPLGEACIVSVAETPLAVHTGFAAPRVVAELEEEARAAIAAAAPHLPAAATRVYCGEVVPALLAEASRFETTLLVVGTHGHSRAAAIVLGDVGSTLLHKAPCSVLVARAVLCPREFPRRVVVGVDWSPQSLLAYEVARRLAERMGVPLEALIAVGGKSVGRAALPDIRAEEAPPVPALVAAAENGDLLVVGSRGLHGLKALGSVSERVAHEARCSVLVVRSAE